MRYSLVITISQVVYESLCDCRVIVLAEIRAGRVRILYEVPVQ